MTAYETSEFRAALEEAFAQAIASIGVTAFKQMSFFGSNDPSFKVAKSANELKKAA